MNKNQYHKLQAGDIVKVNGKNIYLKVELTNNYYNKNKRYKKLFRVMFKPVDVYLEVKMEDITLVRGSFLSIFNAWYNETKKYRL